MYQLINYELAHFELELYINPWLVAGDEIEQSVSAANVDDPPVETVVLTHFEPLYCNTCIFAGEYS